MFLRRYRNKQKLALYVLIFLFSREAEEGHKTKSKLEDREGGTEQSELGQPLTERLLQRIYVK